MQPVAIPADYRDDTENELVFSKSLLEYSQEMFENWENGDLAMTMEAFEK